MKRVFTFVLALFISGVFVFSQAPEKISYQSVIRDASDNLVADQEIGMQISILEGSVFGAAVYVETQQPTSNSNGLVSIEIGGDDATVVHGNFSDIDWANGPFYLKTETDPDGGNNYSLTGTSQLLSVPYAMYSNIGGLNVMKLHTQDELNLEMSSSIGPNVPGSSFNIGDVSRYKGLILEWRMSNRPEVFHQFVYLSEYDKDVILGNIEEPEDYPRRYTTILSDSFGTMMWLGVSIQGSQLYLSTNSEANARPRLQRIYAIL